MKSYVVVNLKNEVVIDKLESPCLQSAIADATSEIEHTERELNYSKLNEGGVNEYAFNGKFWIERNFE
jgi:hypothetical protein